MRHRGPERSGSFDAAMDVVMPHQRWYDRRGGAAVTDGQCRVDGCPECAEPWFGLGHRVGLLVSAPMQRPLSCHTRRNTPKLPRCGGCVMFPIPIRLG